MNAVWTDFDLNFIKNNAHLLVDKQLALQLSRLTGRTVTVHALRHVRTSLGIRKHPGRGVCLVRRKTPEKKPVKRKRRRRMGPDADPPA